MIVDSLMRDYHRVLCPQEKATTTPKRRRKASTGGSCKVKVTEEGDF